MYLGFGNRRDISSSTRKQLILVSIGQLPEYCQVNLGFDCIMVELSTGLICIGVSVAETREGAINKLNVAIIIAKITFS